MALSAQQLAEFERDGATIVSLPWNETQLAAYEALWDRGPRPSSYGGTTGIVCTSGYEEAPPRAYPEINPCPACVVDPEVPDNIDPDYIRFVAEPAHEAIAKAALKSDVVTMLQTSRMARFPDASHEWEDHRPGQHTWPERYGVPTELNSKDSTSQLCQLVWTSSCDLAASTRRLSTSSLCDAPGANNMHIDHAVGLADLNSIPRRDICSIWVYLNDVPADRAAMRVIPGSHRHLALHWDNMKVLYQRGERLPAGPIDGTRRIGRPGEADLTPYATMEPKALEGRRGEAVVLTQACVHAGFHNATAQPRKVIYTTWVAVQHLSLIGGMNTEDSELGIVRELRMIHPRIRRVLPPERQHIIMTLEQLESERRKWTETWPTSLRHRYRL